MCALSHLFCVVPEYVFCIFDGDGGEGTYAVGGALLYTLGDAAFITLKGGTGGEGRDVARTGDADGGIVDKLKGGNFGCGCWCGMLCGERLHGVSCANMSANCVSASFVFVPRTVHGAVGEGFFKR